MLDDTNRQLREIERASTMPARQKKNKPGSLMPKRRSGGNPQQNRQNKSGNSKQTHNRKTGGKIHKQKQKPEKQKPKSEKELDDELNSYMLKTRGGLDSQLDDYMSQTKSGLDQALDNYMASKKPTEVTTDDLWKLILDKVLLFCLLY